MQRIMNALTSTKYILIGILLVGALFRFYNVNWDEGHHLHPDERAIVATADGIAWPKSVNEFFSPSSSLNPHFFAYGSLPFYLVKVVGQSLSENDPEFAHYALLNIPGRFLSAISDVITIFLIFLLGRALFGAKIGLIASAFYATSVLPIQLSHFYAVDTILTMWVTATLYMLILFYKHATMKRAFLTGLFLGLALATKISALVLVVGIGTALIADFVLLFLKQPHKPKHWLPHLPNFAKHLALYGGIIVITTAVVFAICEPYAIIDFQSFWTQTQQQSAMTKDAFTFPYTLQFVGKVPFVYELKNLFLFGLGPLLGIFAIAGTLYVTYTALVKEKKDKWAEECILLTFFFTYFVIVCNFAIGFMRYLLPLYPLFAIFGAVLAKRLYDSFDIRGKLQYFFIAYFALALLIWPLSFVQIYSRSNTRVQATEWIHHNIPSGSTLAIEHWDDRLPLSGSDYYLLEELPLYDPDTAYKWQGIRDKLERTDYLIIASNRLYTPLQKLTDCANLPFGRCYPQTAKYYQLLFANKLGFQKVAEFTSFPTLPFTSISFNDQGADENFTVFDHPKIMIFQKAGPLPDF